MQSLRLSTENEQNLCNLAHCFVGGVRLSPTSRKRQVNRVPQALQACILTLNQLASTRLPGRTEARPYKHHIINKLTAPQTPNNRISSPLTSYLLPLIEYAFEGFDGFGGDAVDVVRLFEAWGEAGGRFGELLVLLVGQRCVGIDFLNI